VEHADVAAADGPRHVALKDTMLRNLWRICIWVLASIGFVAVAGGLWLMSGGIGAKVPPGRIETAVARRARSLAIPSAIRSRSSPVPSAPDAIVSGMRHFADHCAVCHANNGSGDTEMGRGLYPRPPDMRAAQTQSLTDGELFYIIENGVRLTGMPAWGSGSADSEAASWKLVQFIRHLPAVTQNELTEMEHLNPKGPEEAMDPQDFLEGKDVPSPATPKHQHH
jgi:mono/diheme cytochrome c family protein